MNSNDSMLVLSKIVYKCLLMGIDKMLIQLTKMQKIDTKKSGTKEVTIIATDESGNTSQQKIKIKIKKKPVYSWSNTSSKLNAKNNILNQSAMAMLAQANSQPQQILSLLQ